MRLTDHEKAMLDGQHGAAKARAMDLLMRYGEALGAERLVETNNVAGAFNASTPSIRHIAEQGFDKVYSELNLDSDETSRSRAWRCRPASSSPASTTTTGRSRASIRTGDLQKQSERYLGQRGVNLMATCTPYQVGNVPVKGEHCAWMESSAVIYCNSVLGARTNVEGKESTGAAALTGRIPYWGYHLPENRFGTHLIELDTRSTT
jgi:predicted aconitase